MNLPCAFGKCPGSLHFTLLQVTMTQFYYVTITLFICQMLLRFLITLELRYILVCLFELRMETTLQLGFGFAHDVIYVFVVVTFFDDVRAWSYKLRDLEIMGRVRKFLKKTLILKNLDSIQHHFSKLKLPKVTLYIEPTT